MDFKSLTSSRLQSWLYLYPYSIISYYRSHKSTPANLLQVSDHFEQEETAASVLRLWEIQKQAPSPSLEGVILRYFIKTYAIAVLQQSMSFILILSESVLLFYLIKYLNSDDQGHEIGIWLVCALILNGLLAILLHAKSTNNSSVIGADIMRIITDLVSNKVLKVHSSAICKENVRGKFLNVISADLASFEGIPNVTRFISSIFAIVFCLD